MTPRNKKKNKKKSGSKNTERFDGDELSVLLDFFFRMFFFEFFLFKSPRKACNRKMNNSDHRTSSDPTFKHPQRW